MNHLKIKKIPMKSIWIILACISLPILNYEHNVTFLSSLINFIIIIIFLRLAFKKRWRDTAGLRVCCRHAVIAFTVTAVMTGIVYYYISRTVTAHGIAFQNRFELGNQELYFYTVFQTLNEEIITGALLLFSVRKKWPGIHPVIISIGAAMLFTVAHGLMYRFAFDERSIIELPALIALFAVGIIRNNTILGFNHIGFSWALHLSWNLVFFGGRYSYVGTATELDQADLFNGIMGEPAFIAAMIILSIITSFFLFRNRRRELLHGRALQADRDASGLTDRVKSDCAPQ